MKKIVLINPPMTDEARYGRGISKLSAVFPPLGLMYLGAVLEKEKYDVNILDCQLLNLNVSQTVAELIFENIGVIGIFCNTAQLATVHELCREIKRISPNTPIIVGGPHPSISPEELLTDDVDYVVIGEGEETIVQLLKHIEHKENKYWDINDVDGIAYKTDGGIIGTSPRELIKDLDTLPFPARHLLPINSYRPSPQHYKRLPMTTMITSRGCPHACKFCSSQSIWGRRYRKRSVKNVIEEIMFLQMEYHIKDINFWDDLWGIQDKWILEFCKAIKDNDIDLTWSCELRVDSVGLPVLKEMKEAGCWAVFYGMENTNQKVLDTLNKKIRVEQIKEAIKNTKLAGIEVRANFIIGLPGSNKETDKAMIHEVVKMNPDFVKFNAFTPYPGTEFYKEIKEGGHGVMTEERDKLTLHYATFTPDGYKSIKSVAKMKSYAHKKFYLRPKYVLGRLRKIRSFKDFKKYWDGMLAVVSS